MRFPLHVFTLPNGETLKLAQQTGVLGGQIWPSAKTICRYLENLPTPQDKVIKTIELGSGSGVVGLYAAGLGMQVTLTEHRPPMAAAISSVAYNVDGSLDYGLLEKTDGTDQAPPRSNVLLNLLDTNVRQNQHLFRIAPQVKELDWTIEGQLEDIAQGHFFDLIIASDVTYLTNMHGYLANVIGKLLNVPHQKCILAHQQRVLNLKGQDYQLTSFVDILNHQHNLNVEQVLEEEDEENNKVKILEIRR